MMYPGSLVSSKASSSTAPLSLLSPLDTEGTEKQMQSQKDLSLPLPCWATQALCDLAHSETELKRLQERQAVEAEVVGRGVERALLGVQREECRLLERVEQDYRDLQCRLEQVQRDNAAAIRVGQALVDQRLHQILRLREQINAGGCEVDQKRDLLLKAVAELLQPREIALALKRVSFKPSAQPKAVNFGVVKVQDHNVNFPVGGCGPQGQLCSLHAFGGQCENHAEPGKEGRSTPDGAGSGQGQVLSLSNSSRGQRIVRKIKLSARSDDDSGEEVKPLSPPMQRWPPKQVPSERDSSQDEECESPTCESKGDELFLAVPALLSNGESEGEDFAYRRNGSTRPLALHTERMQRGLSPSPEPGYPEHNFDYGDLKTGTGRSQQNSSRFRSGKLPSSRNASHSCQDLLSRDRSLSRLSTSSDDHAYTRAPSPAESVDSGYTFIVSSSRNYPCPKPRLSKSSADLSHLNRPLIDAREQWRAARNQQSSLSSSSSISSKHMASRAKSSPSTGNHSPRVHARCSWGVSRSLSMSVIDGSLEDRLNHHADGRLKPQDGVRLWGDRSEPVLPELDEDAEPLALEGVQLVRQFGKQGSGRADLTLPSGVHATPQGQLFLVDCGNARVQVTDQCGNVIQQVTSPSKDSGDSSKRCRNYFDVAVNAKGLIALSCAAERALLILSRHGRLLQTFGGGPYIAGVPRDELEAPRGVTVTQKDEFLVADIRKGTLTAMKLEPKTGSRLERTVVTGFHRPYLVTACLHSGLVAVSERGSDTGREPCVKVLGPGWNTLRILGICSGMGPVLTSPWGLCIDKDGAVLVADWAEQHRVVLYMPEGTGRVIVTEGLSSPRGLALLPNGLLVVSDSMHHCIKVYKYK
ncbi:uncharacterized protein [Salminus brasiliensis]|uniref:uncharacterized protein n=1 Tax=Salminus brasiliensis TaxID=930266 RepID=UPI003B82D2F8